MMELFIEPVDVWLFRDGKPFDALSDHRARSLFPPYPTVMQGVIRSHHLVVKGVDLRNPAAIEKAVGTVEDFGNLRLRGPFIAQKVGDHITRYFPVPADVVPDRQAGGYRPFRPRPREEAPYVLTSAPADLPMLLWQPEGYEPSKQVLGQWLAEEELLKCLRGELVTAVPGETLFTRENRFGIGRDDATRTTLEGALYEVEFIRPCAGVGLWVQVEGYDGWPEAGLMRIGGEGRGAHFSRIESSLGWPQMPDPLPERFKVYFASPTLFEEGWKPKDWGRFFAGEVTLQAVALNRYASIGGFDWASSGQKPARRCVPAGSVYYFACNGQASRAGVGEGTAFAHPLVNQAITDYGAEIGFGQVIITEW